MCVVVLDAEGKPIGCNDTYETEMGPLYKFANIVFDDGACGSEEARRKLGKAMHAVRRGAERKVSVKNVEMVTLEGDAGLPLRRHFDWSVGTTKTTVGGSLILLGEPCSERTMEQRAKDAELVDFFQNAPIALHWLSGEGIILWANQTELDVLQYTAEEYIGQPVMKFCPDEEDLVLEIFKTLGSGNIIKDVPVRFRRKDGAIVPLLIDSNVNYKADGSFNHTRCFIRDDTGRRVREARAASLADEMVRSLQLLDNFMSNTLHFVRTPCNVMMALLEEARDRLEEVHARADVRASKTAEDDNPTMAAVAGGLAMIQTSVRQLGELTSTLDDVSDLQRFEQGAEFRPVMNNVELLPLCRSAVATCAVNARLGVECVLEIDEGKSAVPTDPKQLRRVLDHLLRNAVAWTQHGSVHFSVSHGVYPDGAPRCVFTVSDTGSGVNCKNDVFFKYHQLQTSIEAPEGLEASQAHLDSVQRARDRQIEDAGDLSNKSLSKGVGVGLPLSYNIVNALGGELCFTSEPGNTSFYFSLPYLTAAVGGGGASSGDGGVFSPAAYAAIPSAEATRLTFTAEDAADEMCAFSGTNYDTIMSTTDTVDSNVGTSTGHAQHGDLSSLLSATHLIEEVDKEADLKTEATFVSLADASKIITPSSVAAYGLAAMEPPHVLVVEDTPMCWKMLKMSLMKMKCTVDVAEDGAQALEAVKKSIETQHPYQLVLMDLRMPVKDGFEATRTLKGEMKYKTPIVALTAETGSDVRERCKEIGFDEFVQKPLKNDLLKTILSKFAQHVVG